ncbi:MAG: peptidoglycan editing factor PgeF [Pseudomonadales bacterium]|nr:peptidoglycan editing factor PgeF [Pseudomonadales bacterium]
MVNLQPDWPVPHQVKALFTTREGGVSAPPYDSLNLAHHVGDGPASVNLNRALIALPDAPHYLVQVHSNRCVCVDELTAPVEADASFTETPGSVLAIMVADCLPVFFTSRQGNVVGIAHAGWRGLASGVLRETVARLTGDEFLAWMGPAIGPCHYEVGDDVRDQFSFPLGFTRNDNGRWQMDLYAIARDQLENLGVEVFGGGYCTYCDEARFFSYRRDGVTGRMGGFIWIANN